MNLPTTNATGKRFKNDASTRGPPRRHEDTKSKKRRRVNSICTDAPVRRSAGSARYPQINRPSSARRVGRSDSVVSQFCWRIRRISSNQSCRWLGGGVASQLPEPSAITVSAS